ncbi:GIY-YIG nuclease family protein [Flavihumibacter rivuli]|uniref:GIY-YIG nuclease family protein n=1 Tax=Flavihumibacter rivuli TaxID=2838156 RepID=UPI001BDDCF42|nr:GIY-YIG nuclease family protein [Flavihumibacter rivuli]ULQ54956.1 GIY-YIG nuclease family protein [Flavihumibacter rivuli]
MYFVYILRCSNGDHYKGCTSDLDARVERHQLGMVPATAGIRPVELIFYCAFTDKYKAFSFEQYLKSGSGRAFMRKRLV